MEDKSNLPKQFDLVYHGIDPPVDNHEKSAAEQQNSGTGACWIGPRVGRMSTALHYPVLSSTSDNYLVAAQDQGTRVLTPGQPPTLAAPETRPGNGEDPASPELPRPEVAKDSESPPDVRDPPFHDHGQHMEYQVISASRQTMTLTDCPPPSSA